jgi:hypothetical protein
MHQPNINSHQGHTLKYFFYLLLAIVSTSANAKPLEPYEVPTEVYLDRAGLPELVLQSTMTGFIVGPMITYALFDDELRQSSGFLLGPALGVALPFLLNKGQPVHAAQASTYNFFQRTGLGNGLMLAPILLSIDGPDDPDSSSLTKSTFIIIAGTTLASTWLGTYLEPKMRLSPGQASALSSSYFIGASTSLALYFTLNEDPSASGAALTSLITANGLSLTTYLMRDLFDIDRSRVIMMDIGAVGGGIAGLGLGFFIFGEDVSHKALVLSSVVGVYGGLYLAYALTKSFDSYKKGASATAGAISFESPTPMVVTSVNSESGSPSLGFGLNILNGTW